MRKELNVKQKRVMVYFIAAAKELLETEGVEHLTARKVAARAGYNSATLYNYFEDMEELEVFASISYLSRYIYNLGKALDFSMNARERYRTIYEVFCRSCFEKPELFYNLFYGRYKKHLKNVISMYYNLFPDELGQHQGEILQMLTQGDIEERDMAIMPSLVTEGFVAQENVKQTVIIITRTFQGFLYDAWMKYEERTVDQWCTLAMETFDYVLSRAGHISF